MLAVERMNLGEALEALRATLAVDGSGGDGVGCWGDTKESFQKLRGEITALGDVLDGCTHEQPTGLSTTRRILHTCKGSTLQGQWEPLVSHLNNIHQVLIPATLRLFTLHRLHPGELARLSQIITMLQRRDVEEIARINDVLTDLVPEVEIMLVRVESWFDDAFEGA